MDWSDRLPHCICFIVEIFRWRKYFRTHRDRSTKRLLLHGYFKQPQREYGQHLKSHERWQFSRITSLEILRGIVTVQTPSIVAEQSSYLTCQRQNFCVYGFNNLRDFPIIFPLFLSNASSLLYTDCPTIQKTFFLSFSFINLN